MIPVKAMPVVKILRKDVKKPDGSKLVEFYKDIPDRCPGWESVNNTRICPMGLHPLASSSIPMGLDSLPIFVENHDIYSFYTWWDNLSLEEAREAIDLIWNGEE